MIYPTALLVFAVAEAVLCGSEITTDGECWLHVSLCVLITSLRVPLPVTYRLQWKPGVAIDWDCRFLCYCSRWGRAWICASVWRLSMEVHLRQGLDASRCHCCLQRSRIWRSRLACHRLHVSIQSVTVHSLQPQMAPTGSGLEIRYYYHTHLSAVELNRVSQVAWPPVQTLHCVPP